MELDKTQVTPVHHQNTSAHTAYSSMVSPYQVQGQITAMTPTNFHQTSSEVTATRMVSLMITSASNLNINHFGCPLTLSNT